MTLRKVATLDDLWSGEMMSLDVAGNNVLLLNVGDRVYAYGNACPHQKSPLHEGTLTGTTLRCARHHWEFDVATGRGINPQDACLKVFPVTVERDDIYLDLDEAESAETASAEKE